jgi:AcrR family transcriptional regulator
MATATTPTAAAPARRDRLRAETLADIKAAARRELVATGPAGIALRAVARDVGLTAPALYRYFPRLEDLVSAVTVDLFDELCDAMEEAASGLDDPFARMLALARAFRRWAMNNPHEFALLFSIAPTSLGEQPTNACQEASDRFGNLFAGTFIAMWQVAPFEVVPDRSLSPDLRAGLNAYWTWLTDTLAPSMPMAAVVVFLEGWIRIFGSVAMEAFGHLSWALPDGEPMFEQVMRSLAVMVGRPEAYAPPV